MVLFTKPFHLFSAATVARGTPGEEIGKTANASSTLRKRSKMLGKLAGDGRSVPPDDTLKDLDQ
jgi:hypothetical protein